MTSYECAVNYGKSKYRITVTSGFMISVTRNGMDNGEPIDIDIFFAQDEEASEYINMLDKYGAKYLLRYLDSAGVEL